MSELSKLSRRERQIMEVVYRHGEATLSQMREEIEDPPTRAALRSILNILEDKKHLRHRKEGREFVYSATKSRVAEGRSAFNRIIDTFFDGSLGQALATHLASPDADYSQEEINDLIQHLEQAKATKHSGRTKG